MLTDITLPALDYICLNLRASDKLEILGMRPHDAPLRLAWESFSAIRNLGRGRVAWADGRPAGVFAFTEQWPGTWEIWMFGTDQFRAVAIPLLRWARGEANDILSTCLGRRLHCDVREGHPDAHRLLKAMGALAEGQPMAAYGKDGSAYQRYVWLKGVNDAVLNPHYKRAA